MNMEKIEYKSVVLPQTIMRRRKRKETAVDVIQSEITKILNEQASSGWEFVSSEIMKTFDRKGILGAPVEKPFTVLIFKRPMAFSHRNTIAEPSLSRE
jgi:hypothetical protein